ncbi:GAF domain-containing protein [Amnibacterium sp.]|uniref:GAF domain-containing protein n=1 Tax=Amnibacterium sp. TaxID=1872496 RepID=UPI002637974D|nr:GAF domain-containing protein [Amnibacterium sp.]MCU1472882.1 diguanylate cyclase [Amnibacterium sp.]
MTSLRTRVRALLHATLTPAPGVPVLPSGPPFAHASGADPYRLLLIGDESVAGHGVASHDLGPAGWLAREVAELTQHGVDVEVLGLSSLSSPGAEPTLTEQRLRRVDAAVLLLNYQDFPHVAASTTDSTRLLVSRLRDHLTAATPIIVVAAPPLRTSPGSSRLQAFSQRLRSSSAGFCTVDFIDLEDSRGPIHARTPSETYRSWAKPIAKGLVPRLHAPKQCGPTDEKVDEAVRQTAVEQLGARDGAWTARFDRYVSYIRAAYGTKYAALSVVDEEHTHFAVRYGFDRARMPKLETVCGSALLHPCGLLIGNARDDDRFRQRALVREGLAGFYAGYPVMSRDGHPVGVLCVFDPSERNVEQGDIALLRDFALGVQEELWRPPSAVLPLHR